MSKLKPEIGDVWVDNNTKKPIYVFGIYKTSWGEYVCWCSYLEKELELINENVGKNLFLQNYTYVGKSKVSIKELFDVKKEENEKDNLATDLKQIVRDSAKQAKEIIDNWNKGVI